MEKSYKELLEPLSLFNSGTKKADSADYQGEIEGYNKALIYFLGGLTIISLIF